jgi:uncharacterized membrane protein (UPF0136 family)
MMGILLAFAPFFVFIVVERLVGVTAGLAAATVTSAGLLVREALRRNKTIKVLEVGTLFLFGGLTAYTLMVKTAWSIPAVRLCVDAGLLVIVLISLAVRQPFTLQYAREQVSRELWNTPEFVRTNYIITSVWAAAFALMVAADLLMLWVPSLPTFVAIAVTIAALWGAARFTSWYPERVRAAHDQQKP